MDDGLRLSEAEIQKIFSLLSSSTTFQGFTKGVLTEFIKNCDVNDLGPHDLIWDEQNGNDLDFMVVVAGCVAVWGKNYDEETVDAFLGPGKIIGASEYFRLDSTASQFKTLTDCRLLVASQIAIDVLKENATSELTESERCQLFYRNICRSLLERLRSQISVLKVRTGQNDKRLAKLFENFTRDPGWRELTTIKTKLQMDGFKIGLFFTADLLEGLLSSQERVIAPVVKQFIKEGLIQMYSADDDFLTDKSPVPANRFPIGAFPNFPYFQFEVLNHTKLMKKIE